MDGIKRGRGRPKKDPDAPVMVLPEANMQDSISIIQSQLKRLLEEDPAGYLERLRPGIITFDTVLSVLHDKLGRVIRDTKKCPAHLAGRRVVNAPKVDRRYGKWTPVIGASWEQGQ